MPRLQWDAIMDRTHEFGVDRGVLYVRGEAGVPWNGLISFTEKPTGGERSDHYADDQRYVQLYSQEEFEGTLEAYTYPDEFMSCDGTKTIQNGLGFTQQDRSEFDFSYRTRVGNGLDSFAHYKIHIVYNATATPSERNYQTQGENVEAMTFSWDVKTLSVLGVPGKPTAHFVIDTRKTPRKLVQNLEDILYGVGFLSPRVPQVRELVSMFESEGPVIARNMALNPLCDPYGASVVVANNPQQHDVIYVNVSDHPLGIGTAKRSIAKTSDNQGALSCYNLDGLSAASISRRLGVWVKASAENFYSFLNSPNVGNHKSVSLLGNRWHFIEMDKADTGHVMLFVNRTGGSNQNAAFATGIVALEDGKDTPMWKILHGSMAPANGIVYGWEDQPNRSPSFAKSWAGPVVYENLVANGKMLAGQYAWSGKTEVVLIGDQYWMKIANDLHTYASFLGKVGGFYSAGMTVKGPPGLQIPGFNSTDNVVGGVVQSIPFTIPPSGEINVIAPASRAVSGISLYFGFNRLENVYVTKAFATEVEKVGDYAPFSFFDGDTKNTPEMTYHWEWPTEPNRSRSFARLR